MLLCKQEEAEIQLNAEQADWSDDTDDDELEDQELEAYYMYMAQIQEVSLDAADSRPIFDDEPLQKIIPVASRDEQWYMDTGATSHLSSHTDTTYLLLYVDDIILTAFSTSLLQRIISLLHAKFAMTDLGPLNYFLGISVTRTTSGIFLSQTKYAIEILEQAHMLSCNYCRTPIGTEKKLRPEGSSVTDPTLYHSLAGSLQYLTFTRPNLSHSVLHLCLYMHDP
nr:ribonuclease H-like domain-containing protein [Tanacetum cinerariifolium]